MVTSGFFNSVNGDRRYDAEKLGAIFDGILKDGVYSTIGQAFAVSVNTAGTMMIQVGTGRAWFNHTWTYNDEILVMEVQEAPLVGSRYDAVVLEVNKSENERQNTIKFIVGDATDNPQKPTMDHTSSVNQYPLAYIYVGQGVAEILPENIEVTVGTDECPFCTGVLEHVSIEDLLAAWQQEFDTCLDTWKTAEQTQFEQWFANLVYVLDGDVAGHLQNEIDDIINWLNSVGRAEEEEF